ncbi:MAG: hypothetical protein ACPLKX_07045 [Dictyoglomaceae bacterium]
MSDIIMARIRLLITFLLFSYFLYLGMFLESFGLRVYFIILFLYNLLLYYLFKKEIIKESFVISLFDETFIYLLLFLIKGIELKFIFLIFFPVVKEVIYERYNFAYILSFLSWITLICFSVFISPFIPLEVSMSILPFSFLIPYISIYYSKEKGG